MSSSYVRNNIGDTTVGLLKQGLLLLLNNTRLCIRHKDEFDISSRIHFVQIKVESQFIEQICEPLFDGVPTCAENVKIFVMKFIYYKYYCTLK